MLEAVVLPSLTSRTGSAEGCELNGGGAGGARSPLLIGVVSKNTSTGYVQADDMKRGDRAHGSFRPPAGFIYHYRRPWPQAQSLTGCSTNGSLRHPQPSTLILKEVMLQGLGALSVTEGFLMDTKCQTPCHKHNHEGARCTRGIDDTDPLHAIGRPGIGAGADGYFGKKRLL